MRPKAVCLAVVLAGWVSVAMSADANGVAARPAIPTDPFAAAQARLDRVSFPALRLAIEDLRRTFSHQYPKGDSFLVRLTELEGRLPAIRQALASRQAPAIEEAAAVEKLQREALLANPLLDFDKLLVILRKPRDDARRPKGEGYGLGEFLGLPRQSSWQQDEIPNVDRWTNEIAVLSRLREGGELRTLYRPATTRLVGDIDLDFEAGKLLFSMPDEKLRWQVHELEIATGKVRRITSGPIAEVHNYDACYLPGGRIAFISTAPLQGVPCNAGVNVGMLFVMDADGGNIRQLAFDQDHNYCPTVTEDGQILYLRWEYTDIPHVWGRYLFTMNPDGTCQREIYGSGSYWPNSTFYARTIPGHPTKIVGIVTGHHVGRVGELVLFETGAGTTSTDGVIQRIGGRGKPVEPIILDRLTEESWPKFLHPWPLSEKYFLVAAKPTPRDLWGIYLVDVFDNMTLIEEVEGYALLEPVPLRARPRPPVLASRVDLSRRDAVMYIENIHEGQGLRGVPSGAVRSLRLFTYHFGYQTIAGISHRVGTDGPWEPRRTLGIVPVEADGSAMFRVPANTPISMQPLDANGQALQLMRSWTTAMPGEFVSCVGCHERRTDSALSRPTIAVRKPVAEIQPWRGPFRPYGFLREVQGVLDRFCVGCHDGRADADGRAKPDFRREQGKVITLRSGDPQLRELADVTLAAAAEKNAGVFPPSFIELRRHIHAYGFESDLRPIRPGEFHVNTSPLIQMLRKGHHGVRLDEEAWDRLITWIDLNAPCHGTWQEVVGPRKPAKGRQDRMALQKLYGGIDFDPETYEAAAPPPAGEPIVPKAPPRAAAAVACPGWPFDAAEAARRQNAAGPTRRTIDLGEGIGLELVRIPAGRFVMGDPGGCGDELPLSAVSIDKPFWMGRLEVTNEQYRRFDPAHDSRYEHKPSWVFSEGHLGWPLNLPRQPVVRVSWREAAAFCRWLSQRSGLRMDLPTEAQWEYACRAGSDAAMSYGAADADFSAFANLADRTIRQHAYDTDGRHSADILPRVEACDDGMLVTADAGSYRPNAWGLHDMHGNVWEWTRSARRPYPYRAADGRDDAKAEGDRIVRGGSWRDVPARARSAFRLSYPAWQAVHNVGFRVVVED